MSVSRDDSLYLDRRLFLRQALAGAALAASLGEGRAAPAPAPRPAPPPRKPRACILLWMGGGVSQLDTVDPKPAAPAAIRGAFKAIDTKVKGIQVCEHLPKLALQADKLAFIRSMDTSDSNHRSATYHLRRGYPNNLGVVHPEMGAVAAKYLKGKKGLPRFVSLDRMENTDPGEGFLGPAYQPLRLRRVSLAKAPAAIRELCDVSDEWKRYGDLYGDSSFGRGCLAARRLVEAGVPFVELYQGGYDAHSRIFDYMRVRLQALDPAWSGLLQDLHDRRLLGQTLVVWMSEFGRTPNLNAHGGRDHWTKGWSVVLSGGGIKGGVAHGATNRDGTAITANPVTEGDLLATIYTALGIDPRARNASGTETIPLVPAQANPIKALLA